VETDEEMHRQKVCKVINSCLKDNEDWKNFVKNQLEPCLELEKGKLC
jgi:hypothetical protein